MSRESFPSHRATLNALAKTYYRRSEPEVCFVEVTWTCSRLCAEVPADVNSRDAGLEEMPNRVASGIVGGSDIYLSAPSPGGDQSERATYILYIAIIPLNDFLSAVTHSQP